MCKLFILENIFPFYILIDLQYAVSIDYIYIRKIAQGTVSCSAWADIGPAAAFSGGVRVAGALAPLRPAAVTLAAVIAAPCSCIVK